MQNMRSIYFLRKELSLGFSEASLRGQEEVLQRYIRVLVEKVREDCDGGEKKLNMTELFNFTTFDIAGELVFGSTQKQPPFRCLENGKYHPFIKMLFSSIRAFVVFASFAYLGQSWIVQLLFKLIASKCGGSKDSTTTREMMLKGMIGKNHNGGLLEGLIARKKRVEVDF
ncbi:hypothetical protein QBC38DRAFT_138513 [Podospora fimiseda]|uniref:Uncharacterized protein n=1 Tax=Podospora fimiseda TaxID=252190 RepID=A0AAN6YLC8_9PEZI|nr:hypothetical protein QBC38DRAFT_138513 [Podospora fimiseda]